MVAVVFLTPAFMNLEGQEVTENEIFFNETTTQMDNCADDLRIMPDSKNNYSRHSFRRAVHRFNLRKERNKNKETHNLKVWLWRKLGIKQDSKEDTAPQLVEEDLNQCPICEDIECDTAPHFSNGLCADCNIDEGLLQESQYHQTSIKELLSSMAFSVGIVAVSFGVAWIFAPKLLSSGLFGVGLMARSATPYELMDYKNAGFTVRKHSKPKAGSCSTCSQFIAKGEYKVMVDLEGYKQKRPICQTCATNEDMKANFFKVPTAPKVEPKEPTAPKVEPTPAVKKVTIDLTKSTEKLKVPTSETDALQAIRDLLGGGADEELVRSIAIKASNEAWDLNSAEMAKVIAQSIESMNRTIEKRLDSIGEPTILHISHGKNPVLKMAGVVHHKMKELLWRIVRSQAMNNLYIHGDAGTGKTKICEQLFEALIGAGHWKLHGLKKPTEKKNLFILSCNKDLQSQELIGRESPRFFDDGSGRPAGEWDYIKGAIAPVYEFGGLIVLDEIDRLHPSTLSALNAILANGFFYTPKGVKIERHPSVVFVGTANTLGVGANPKYNAANEQDTATLDRFAGQKVHIDYDPAIENVCAGSVGFADKFRAIRKAVEAHEISNCVISYRAMANNYGHVQAGASEDWVLRQFCLGWGEEAAMKMGHGNDVSLDFSDENLWGSA